jgi:trans-aconitate methyltransferase
MMGIRGPGRGDAMDRKLHWQQVYTDKAVHETSWHQANPAPSLNMIAAASRGRSTSLLDVGGGASLLVDRLLDLGFHDLTVLDIAGAALDQARRRLGPRAADVTWIEADVTQFEPARTWEVWHDRAAFHFLTEAADRKRYVAVLKRALADNGQAIIAAFAPDGPRRCSGLDVVRYDAASLAAELGQAFTLRDRRFDTHRTPAGREQRFGFYRFCKGD